jgi:hypothetical protein
LQAGGAVVVDVDWSRGYIAGHIPGAWYAIRARLTDAFAALPAAEAFAYIHNLPGDAVVVFLKPRALSYYSNRKAAYVTRNIPPDQLLDLFRRIHAHYFLLCNENEEVNDVMLKKFLEDNKNEVSMIWQNSLFDLYTDLN